MIALLSLFAFNLFGLFEINLPSSTSTSAVKLSNKDGMVGAFISGGFMTLLATPCSAPFLGPALGYAFSKDTLSLFLILTLVGIGLALPYLLLTLVPNLQRFLPKPGDWMVHFKHFTGFVLLGTALFLIWVLGSFGGEEFVVSILIWVLITGLWSWIFGIFAPIPTPIWRRIFMWIVLIMVSLYWFTSVLKPTYLIPQSNSQTETGWKAFDADEIAKISQGKVFIDFTAKWCISCRANKNLVLETSEVENAFKNGQVHLYRADWTQKSKHITKALASYGRSAVPTYVFITDGKVEVLPELLTKSMLVQRSQ
jgi:thiol:disulfide interchange protein DsbD